MVLKENTNRLSLSEYRRIRSLLSEMEPVLELRFSPEERVALRDTFRTAMRRLPVSHDTHGLCKGEMTLETAKAFAEAIEPDRNILLAIAHLPLLLDGALSIMEIKRAWGDDVAGLLTGIVEVDKFSSKNNAINHDNFRGLMVSLADDIRVIIIMIVRNLVLMRAINRHPDEEWVRNVAFEANYLYAQLAHRLGLYKIKGELEDLSLKYTNREIYTSIARKLNETKKNRDAYIKSFIDPVKEKLLAAGLRFEIKGRTKSISSIWSKMKKQKVDIQGIYDLFAIRVIIDTPREREKSDCWLAYSILADMYTANPARMKDWISIPKSNGYESLHATVMGPESKWVEVQFRTRRMDLVAEKGLAAHWRYKGVKSDSTDQWMANVRDILETAESGPMQLMKDMKMDVYAKEVFAFTPKGDLFRMSDGATVLDFAFQIHTNVGAHCSGAIVNGNHRKITYRIANGDTVEILTSSSQSPKADWLNIVVTSKARNKIRQSLNEEKQHKADLGRELLERRAKNRKVELDEAVLMKLIKKHGYSHALDFFADIADEEIDPGRFISTYVAETTRETEQAPVSADGYHMERSDDDSSSADMMVIGEKSIDGLKYRFAKCCSPIFGDPVFGFISSDGMVKIHRADCPNAANIRERYPYRIIKAGWSGRTGELLAATLRIVGKDDIGILANITSIISKESNVTLRNISVDSHDGVFQGILVVGVPDTARLQSIVRKIRTVKGVRDVERM